MYINIDELKSFEANLKVGDVVNRLLEEEKQKRFAEQEKRELLEASVKGLVGRCFKIQNNKESVWYLKVLEVNKVIKLSYFTGETISIMLETIPMNWLWFLKIDYTRNESTVEILESHFENLVAEFKKTVILG